MIRRLSCLAVLAVFFLLQISAGVATAEEAAERLQYRLGPGDKLQVNVFGQPDLSGEFQVDGSGSISLPLIGEVKAGANTLRDLETIIVNKLKPDYLKNPRVSVQVLNYRPFYILGEVKNPGSYPFVNGMKIINAIALAGGYTYRAREGKPLVTHANDPERRKIAAGDQTPVLPGDVIIVPERFF